MTIAPDRSATDGLRQLRHDLINPLNVLVGATSALMASELDDGQRTWARILQSTAERLLEIVNRLESYHSIDAADGQARLADLCSIAAARIGKPFDRARLLGTVEAVTGRRAPRVLLVDDSPELAMLVRSYARGSDWDLEVVETGERAVAQATTERYDVVLMDIDLPGLDGATAAHAIRAADLARGVSPTPIVALTAFSTDTADTPRDVTDSRIERVDHPIARVNDAEIASLIPEFLDRRRAEVDESRRALDAGDYGRIQSIAHRMKGTGRGYGFEQISRIGSDLEEAARRHDAPSVARSLDELEMYLRDVS